MKYRGSSKCGLDFQSCNQLELWELLNNSECENAFYLSGSAQENTQHLPISLDGRGRVGSLH